MQHFIKLSAAVHELSSSERKNNAAVDTAGSEITANIYVDCARLKLKTENGYRTCNIKQTRLSSPAQGRG